MHARRRRVRCAAAVDDCDMAEFSPIRCSILIALHAQLRCRRRTQSCRVAQRHRPMRARRSARASISRVPMPRVECDKTERADAVRRQRLPDRPGARHRAGQAQPSAASMRVSSTSAPSSRRPAATRQADRADQGGHRQRSAKRLQTLIKQSKLKVQAVDPGRHAARQRRQERRPAGRDGVAAQREAGELPLGFKNFRD